MSAGTFSFKPASSAPITSKNKIVNVVPGDFNRDGRLDVLVMSQSNPGSWWSDNVVHLDVHLGQGDYAFGSALSIPSATGAQPMILDYFGNMRPDLLGVPSDNNPEGNLSIWRNSEATSSLFETVAFSPSNLTQPCKLADPHSNAFIDLNGDCLAGMFLNSICLMSTEF